MTRMRYLPAVLLTLFSCAAGAAEDGGYLISAWRMDDGLPPLVSPVLTEAPEGYLWTRAEAGPVRFDGIRFTVFSSSLTGWPQGIKISKLTADTHQGLWVVLRDRSLWRERGGIWTRYAAMSDTEHIVSMVPARRSRGIVAGTTQGRLLRCTDDPPSVTELMPRQPGFIGWLDACDAEGGIWFAANGGSRRWINGKVEHIKYPAEENKDDFIFPYTDGTMWIIGPDYVARWSDGAFQKLPPISGLAPQRLAGILPAPPHGVWASTKDRLYFLPEGASKWDGPWPWATRAEQRQLTNLADVNGHHWIATYGFGFLHVSPEGTQIPERLPPDLAGNRILNFIEDRERNIWAVAEGSGLVRLQTKRFEVHRAGAGLSDPEVMAVAEDSSGTLWAGSRAGGVDILKKGLWSHVTLPPGDEPAAAVTSLLPRKGKGILAGTESRGVWEQTGSNWSPLGSSKVAARVLLEDNAGTLWMGGPAGLFKWSGAGWAAAPATSAWPAATSMTQDSAGRLWVATAAGAWRAGADGKFAPVPSEEGLPAMGACSFLSEPDGRVWIGFENGLASWRDGKATFRQTGKGIPVRRVAGIYPPENGKLWFSSPEGLTSLSIADFEQDTPGARVFTRADGLPTAEASSGFHPCVWRGGNGHFWLPTHLGLVEFDPKTMPPPAAPPSVVIEEATASFEEKHQSLTVPPLDRQPGSLDKGDSLEAGLRRLEFRFTAPSLSAPGNVRFRWKLEGLDAAWSAPSPQRTATYATVPPGNYRFRVLACNGDGVWNETGAAVPFLIPPLWHERPAVWVAAAALAVMAAGFAVRSRYGRRIELLRLRSTLEHERARIAQDIHDDLGATLTQISLWSAFAQKRAEEGLAGHLAKIRERSIDAVRSLDQIVWAVNPSNDTVKNFATYVCQMAGDFFRETAVACRIDLKEPVEDGPLNADVRHHLVLAAREACTNALRHSGGTEVLLHVKAEEGRILIIVNDNGCGFDPAKITGESEGLAGMSRRLRSIGGRCEVRSAPGEGTQVRVEWPSREAEAAD